MAFIVTLIVFVTVTLMAFIVTLIVFVTVTLMAFIVTLIVFVTVTLMAFMTLFHFRKYSITLRSQIFFKSEKYKFLCFIYIPNIYV